MLWKARKPSACGLRQNYTTSNEVKVKLFAPMHGMGNVIIQNRLVTMVKGGGSRKTFLIKT